MAVNKYKIKNGESRYKATLWVGNKPIQSKTFKRKIDADQWLARESIKEEDQKSGRLKGVHTSVRTFFNEVYFPNCGVRESTSKDYFRMFQKTISPMFGERMLSELAPSDWAIFFNNLKRQGTSGARLNRIHAVSSAMYSLAVKWDYVLSNPLLRVDWEKEKISGEHKYLSEDELSKFLNYAYLKSPDLFPLYHFMYETGLSISEALALKWDCVNFDQSLIEVRRAYSRIVSKVEENTKSGHKRVLAFGATTRETLLKLYNKRNSTFVFSRSNGEMLSYERVRERFAKDIKAAGIPPIGIHGLRHTFASHYMMRNGNIYDLKSLLGHSGIETTMRYAHLSPKHLASKVSLVNFKPQQESNIVALKSPNHFPTIKQSSEEKNHQKESLDSTNSSIQFA